MYIIGNKGCLVKIMNIGEIVQYVMPISIFFKLVPIMLIFCVWLTDDIIFTHD